jgi:hypothetical protein
MQRLHVERVVACSLAQQIDSRIGRRSSSLKRWKPPPMPQRELASTLRTPPASETEPFRLTFLGKAMEITGRIDSEQSADDLIRAISALKVLLRPERAANRPEDEQEAAK